jgi:hypothetical protein
MLSIVACVIVYAYSSSLRSHASPMAGYARRGDTSNDGHPKSLTTLSLRKRE